MASTMPGTTKGATLRKPSIEPTCRFTSPRLITYDTHSASEIAIADAVPAYKNVCHVAVRVSAFSNTISRILFSVRLSSEKPRPHAFAKAAWQITTSGMKNDKVVTNRHQASATHFHGPSATGRRSPP